MRSYHVARARRSAAVVTSVFLLALLAVPGIAYAIDLTSGGGLVFDITETGQGSIGDGDVDAYDTAYVLEVNGTVYTAGGAAATTSLAGRQLEMAEVTMGTLRVKRIVYVPPTVGTYARFLDVVSNPGTAPVNVTLRIRGNLGSDSSTVTTGSSSGDMLVSVADNWFATDDGTDPGGDTPTAHVAQGGGGSLQTATMVSLSGQDFFWEFAVTVPAGGRVAILSFAIQAANRAASLAEAARVVDLPADALVGIESYLRDIVNFPVGGAPIVRFTAPATAAEGDAITITAEVSDLEGDTPSWSWDLNGDGVFGELVNGTTHTVPAGTTDGPADLTFAIRASDGTEMRVVRRTIGIVNVPPVITSVPPTMAAVRREYTHQLTIEDPGGVLDPPNIRLTARPGGMLITPEGLITWTPPIEFRGEDYSATALVTDGDGDQDELTWTISVAENTTPGAPMPISPIDRVRVTAGEPVTLTIANATDDDGDPLVYSFQLSPTSNFEGASLSGSGEVREGPDGMTSWTTPGDLSEGFWYWRVWANDGIGDGPMRNAAFAVGAEGVIPGSTDAGVIAIPDAGGTEAPRASGCSIDGAPGASRGGWSGLAIALAALAMVRRRGRRATGEAK